MNKRALSEQADISNTTVAKLGKGENVYKVAFLGVDKHSIVSIGTYGQIKSTESKRYFREGLVSMLEELEPEVVLVYGAMPGSIFHGLDKLTQFVQYPDWISRVKGKERRLTTP